MKHSTCKMFVQLHLMASASRWITHDGLEISKTTTILIKPKKNYIYSQFDFYLMFKKSFIYWNSSENLVCCLYAHHFFSVSVIII